jgi:hypothetical protein
MSKTFCGFANNKAIVCSVVSLLWICLTCSENSPTSRNDPPPAANSGDAVLDLTILPDNAAPYTPTGAAVTVLVDNFPVSIKDFVFSRMAVACTLVNIPSGTNLKFEIAVFDSLGTIRNETSVTSTVPPEGHGAFRQAAESRTRTPADSRRILERVDLSCW